MKIETNEFFTLVEMKWNQVSSGTGTFRVLDPFGSIDFDKPEIVLKFNFSLIDKTQQLLDMEKRFEKLAEFADCFSVSYDNGIITDGHREYLDSYYEFIKKE